jgi:hypothetical protein
MILLNLSSKVFNKCFFYFDVIKNYYVIDISRYIQILRIETDA